VVGQAIPDCVPNSEVLQGLRDWRNKSAWRAFMARYRPIVVRFARSLGANAADAEDAAQEVMVVLLRDFERGAYDPSRGPLTSWLCGIAFRKVKDLQRRGGRECYLADLPEGVELLSALEAPDEVSQPWESDRLRAVLLACLIDLTRHLTPQTLAAFVLRCVADWPTRQVAEVLGISRNAVYIGKNRVLSRLRCSPCSLGDHPQFGRGWAEPALPAFGTAPQPDRHLLPGN